MVDYKKDPDKIYSGKLGMYVLRTVDLTVQEIEERSSGCSLRQARAIAALVADIRSTADQYPNFDSETSQEWLTDQVRRVDRILQYEEDAARLFTVLESLGVQIDSVGELEMDGESASLAIDPLIDCLISTPNRELQLDIALLFANGWGGKASIPGLLKSFSIVNARNDPDPNSVRGFIVQALGKYVTNIGPDWFLAVAGVPGNGQARAHAIWAVGKLRKHDARLEESMLGFLGSDDSDVYFPAAQVLGRWKVTRAAERVRSLLDTSAQRASRGNPSGLDPEFEKHELTAVLHKIDSA